MTDWEKVDGITDEDIDFSDIPELDDGFFKNAKIVLPKPKIPITLRIEADVLEWYKSTGGKYQTMKDHYYSRPINNRVPKMLKTL